MFTSRLFKTIRMPFDHDLGPPGSYELPTPDESDHSNESHQEFIHRAQRIFVERGYEKVDSKSALDEQFLLFTRNETLHLVYCLPYEMYVTTIEIQTCWEAQVRLGAESSSVVAPHRFSEGAIHKAEKLGIEWLVV